MSLKYCAFVCVAMGLAALLMIAMAPMTGANVGAIGILLDLTLGQGWAITPIFTLIPLVIVWITYSIVIGLGMYFLLFGGEHEYPPRDERGRPMKASFGRHTSFRWVRKTDDN